MGHHKSNVRDLQFNLFEVLQLEKVLATGEFGDVDAASIRDMLSEAARLAERPLAESFAESDRHPPTFDPDTHAVTLPEPFKKSLKAWQQGEWFRRGRSEEVGGVPAPSMLSWAINEYARMMVSTKAITTLSTWYLNALDYAKTRIQGANLTQMTDKAAPRVSILHHPDVRRALLMQKAYAEGLRALYLDTAAHQDVSAANILSGEDAGLADRVNDLLPPIVKGVGSERAYQTLAESLQTFGGPASCRTIRSSSTSATPRSTRSTRAPRRSRRSSTPTRREPNSPTAVSGWRPRWPTSRRWSAA